MKRHVTELLLVFWFVVLLAILLLFGCAERVRVVEQRRMLIIVERCLPYGPPPPVPADATVAQRADAYVEIERWVRLVASPACLETR